MLAALRQRNFALLWFGQLISLLGDWILFVALPFYIYTLTGSALATGVMFIVQALMMLVGMGLASGLGDRIGIIPMMDVDAVVNILAGIIAFVLMGGTALTKPAQAVNSEVAAREGALL
jgi:MFS family permease